jgi:arginyl-tRNA synthetase
MVELYAELGRRAADGLRKFLGASDGAPSELLVVRAGKPEFGDLQIAACLQLGKQLKRPPRELAEAVRAALDGHPALAKVEVAGPGFVNLRLADAWIERALAALLGDAQLGLRPVGAGQRVVIDYSSPNVAKPMHIGHIRTTIIGAALHRTLAALGWEVIADNHLGDWGTQFGKLIVAYRRWVDAAAYAADPIAELLRLYVRFTEEEKKQSGSAAAPPAADAPNDEELPDDAKAPPILREARAELVKLQAGDPESRALWQKFIDDSRHVFEEIYRRLGIEFTFWHGESYYNDQLAAVCDELREKKIARDSRGALVVFFDEQGEVLPPERAPIDNPKLPPFLVQKSDGGFNYATTDVATMRDRVGPLGASRVIIVTDERQQLHFRQLFAVGRALGVALPLEHVWFGLMRMAEGTIKTREGNVIHLADLLDEAERRATAAAGEHNPELSDAERREVGRVVGLGAVKYNDLSRDRQTLITFTWDKALSLTGNTAPYLQYAYARIRSIVRKAGPPGTGFAAAQEEPQAGDEAAETARSARTIHLGAPVERELGKRLLTFPEVVELVGRSARPHHLCDYLFELAGAFSGFYAEQPVLKAEPAVRASRLALAELTARTLQRGLSLLGIEVLDRM